MKLMAKQCLVCLCMAVVTLSGCGGAGQEVASAAQANAPQAAASLTAENLMDWAEAAFPQYFSPARQPTQTAAPYVLRYYAGTGNYLGVKGDEIYVLGPMSGNTLTKVGVLADFECRVAGSCTPSPVSSIVIESDLEDFIGQGRSYSYTQANSSISVTSSGSQLSVTVNGDQKWQGDFRLGSAYARLQPGRYPGAASAFVDFDLVGGFTWSGEGRGCTGLNNSLTIDEATYAGSTLESVVLSFSQHCGGRATATRGTIRWYRNDATQPPGPVVPPPALSWNPFASVVPASGNYVYLESQVGDPLGGGGRAFTYVPATAAISVSASDGAVQISIAGRERWSASFKPMSSVTQLRSGYYPNIMRYPFHNPAVGGMSLTGENVGCGSVTGWFAVDDIAWTAGEVTLLKLRFEHFCDGATAPLRGKLNWSR